MSANTFVYVIYCSKYILFACIQHVLCSSKLSLHWLIGTYMCIGKDAFILDKYSVQGSLPKVAAEVCRVVLLAMHLTVSCHCVYMYIQNCYIICLA